VTFTPAGTNTTAGVPDFTEIEIKHSHLRLLHGEVRTSSPIHGAGMHRRFAASRDINDDDHVEPLSSVQRSLRREQLYRRSLAVADGVAALVITMVTAVLWGAPLQWQFLLMPVVAVVIAKIEGLYDRDDMVLRKSTLGEWRTLLRASTLTAIAAYLIWWIATAPPDGRGIRVFAFLLLGMFILVLPLRTMARRLARSSTSSERCVIVGAPHRCAPLASHLSDMPGVELIGAVSDDDVDCSVAGIHELVEQLGAERIIVVPHPGWGERGSLKLIQSAKWLGVRVSLMPTVMTVVGAAAAIDELDSMVLLGVPRFGLSRSSEALKRTFDLSFAVVALVVTAPLLMTIALFIRFESPGPALFRQKRIGRAGRPFTMYKFRSMVEDAERMKASLDDGNETAGLFKMTDDPRVTKVGKFMRRTYLDELPQLFNVIAGNMSLVGPRPLIESEDSLLQGFDRHRSRLTPGMTGPWQLRGPLNAALPELAKLDYLYASNWSVWADIDIILGTAARVLNRHGH
jgi:exopolysaccharide biosynthesis polyprenyl glycosylphosphotransferase